MDREQEEMQFLGVFGIYKEAYKIIFSWKKIFTKITLTLILPLTFIFLAHIEISHVIFKKIITNEEDLSETKEGTTKYKNLSDMISSEWTTLWLFKLVYFTFLLIFSLLSTSAVVYTIASIYTGRDVSFKKVMSVVPKVWKRLMVTFLCTFIAFFAYNVLTFLVIFLWAFTIGIRKGGIAIFVVIVILYIIGFVYLSIVWHLATVVTVLEDSYGIQAMLKSKELIKGKMGLALIITLKLSFSFFIVQFAFEKLVVHGWRLGMIGEDGIWSYMLHIAVQVVSIWACHPNSGLFCLQVVPP
ncbi:Polyadenylate-binding protein 1-B-binding protein [Quillaja saponaria]|uniref:Polyadenylate-binding protein 1-B-binding protein n=1 Tax=Quillaja saponaria TaxID=32244 RepID=A0AAD7LWK2_QUISA|nr:Polyadenylate-binding protein 1-B-binding protein [Quillaja saponaria]